MIALYSVKPKGKAMRLTSFQAKRRTTILLLVLYLAGALAMGCSAIELSQSEHPSVVTFIAGMEGAGAVAVSCYMYVVYRAYLSERPWGFRHAARLVSILSLGLSQVDFSFQEEGFTEVYGAWWLSSSVLLPVIGIMLLTCVASLLGWSLLVAISLFPMQVAFHLILICIMWERQHRASNWLGTPR